MELSRCSRGMILLAVVLGFYAFFFDSAAAVVACGGVAWFLLARAFIVLSSLRSMAGSLTIERSLSHRYIRQGSSLTVTTRIAGPPIPTFSPAFSDIIPSASVFSGDTSSCVPGEQGTCTVSYALTPLTIGEHSFGGVTVTISDRFFTASITIRTAAAAGTSFTVLPSVDYALQGTDIYGERESLAITPVMSRSIRSFRKYVPGDDFRSIDWKLSAKHDELWVREYTGREEETDLIILDLPDSRAPFDPEAFARLKNAAAGSVATRFRSDRPFSILLISGPNLVSFLPGEADPLKLIAMMDRLTPGPRLHHLTRYQSGAALRKKYANPDRWDSPFSERLARIAGAFLAKRSPTTFEVQLARVFQGIKVSSAHLFSLATQDLSHLRLIAERGAMESMTVHLHIPEEYHGPAIRTAVSRWGFSSVEVV